MRIKNVVRFQSVMRRRVNSLMQKTNSNAKSLCSSNSSGDLLIYKGDAHISIAYAMHHPHIWEEHTHETHQFILMPDDGSEAELSWKNHDGTKASRSFSGRHVCFVERGLRHAVRWEKTAAFVCVKVTDEFAREIAPRSTWRGVNILFWNTLIRSDVLVSHLARLAGELCRQDGIGHPQYTQALAILLGAHLLHIPVSPRPDRGKGLSKPQLERVCTHVEQHIDSKLSVKELARLVNLGKDHFTCKFKESTGCTPHRYVMIERVRYAQALLREGKLTKVEVAVRVGFADQSHMVHCMDRLCRLGYGHLL